MSKVWKPIKVYVPVEAGFEHGKPAEWETGIRSGSPEEGDDHIKLNEEGIEIKISFPCCPEKKIIIAPDTCGTASIKCPYCGKYALFDFDRRKAFPGKAIRRIPQNNRTKK